MFLNGLRCWRLLPKPQRLPISIGSFDYPMGNSTASTSGSTKPKVCGITTYPKIICVLVLLN